MRLIYGKWPFYFIIVLFVVSMCMLLIDPILRWRMKNMVKYRMDDLRAPAFVPPFPDESSYSVIKHHTYYGKYFEYLTEFGHQNNSQKNTRDSLIVNSADDEIEIRDNQKIKVIGIKILPVINDANGERTISLDGAWFHPDGRNMTSVEIDELRSVLIPERLTYEKTPEIETTESPIFVDPVGGRNVSGKSYSDSWNYYSHRVEFHVLYNDERLEFSDVSFHDGITGAQIGYNVPIRTHELSDDFKDDCFNQKADFAMQTYAIRPNPQRLALNVLTSQNTQYELDFEVGRGLNYFGHIEIGQILKRIGDNEYIPWEKSEVTADTITFANDFHDTTVVYFEHDDNLPYRANKPETLHAISSDGSFIRATKISKINQNELNNNYFGFNEAPENIEKICFNFEPEVVQVMLDLPCLPLIPEVNFNQDDFMNLTLHATEVKSMNELTQLVSSVTQTSLDSWFLPYGVQTTNQKLKLETQFPLEIKNMTVMDLLAEEKKNYEPFNLLLLQASTNSVRYYCTSNNELMIHASENQRRLVELPKLFIELYIAIGVFMLLKLLYLLLAKNLSDNLKRKGFPKFTIWEAERLVWLAGRRIHKLPDYDELATIPGYDFETVEGIKSFLKSSRKQK